MKYTTIIFDFDGTLVDTLDLFVDVYNNVAPQFGCIQVTDAEKRVLRNKRPQEFFRTYNISWWKLPLLVLTIRKQLKKRMDGVRVQESKITLIKQLVKAGITLGVVSSNTEEVIRKVFAKDDLEQYFSFIYGGNNFFGKDRPIKRIMRQSGYTMSDTIYVGDETRDVESMHRMGLGIVAVTWGYASKKALAALHPTYLCDTMEELTLVLL